MLKSLFSGVSGLQAHQIALDVEANNIANVNTVGFKYSRANFSDLLAQTNQIATSPQGSLGGKNAVQVGLGTSVGSVTRIHSQGSIQNTDKNTDLAMEGDGYFVVSGDGGITDKYTRSGDFKFDGEGNFVDNNGFIVQGWLRDETTKQVDSNQPKTNIIIPPGLTTPASPTSQVIIKANLNSGSQVTNFSSIRSLDAFSNAADLNRDGKLDKTDALQLNASFYDNSPWYTGAGGTLGDSTTRDKITENAVANGNQSQNFIDSNGNVIERGEDFGTLVNSTGRSFNLEPAKTADNGQGVWMSFRAATIGTNPTAATNPDPSITQGTGSISNVFSFTLSNGSSEDVGTINFPGVINDALLNPIDNTPNALAIIDAINKITDKTGVTATLGGTALEPTILFTNNNENEFKNIQFNDTTNILFNAASNRNDEPAKMFRYTDVDTLKGWENNPIPIPSSSTPLTFPVGMTNANELLINGVPLISTPVANVTQLAAAINQTFTIDNISTSAPLPTERGPIYAEIVGGNLVITASSAEATLSGAITGNLPLGVTNTPDTYYFNTTEDLRQGMQELLRNDKTLALNPEGRPGTGISTAQNSLATVEVSVDGKFSIKNPGKNNDSTGIARDINIAVTSIGQGNNSTENVFFTQTMEGLNGSLAIGSQSTRTTGSINAAVHSSSLDIYDSLGSAHTLKIDFRRIDSPTDDGAKWAVKITVPEPGVLGIRDDATGIIQNEVEGFVSFNNDGSFNDIDGDLLRNLTFTANNGSKAGQPINLDFGQKNEHNGLTSFDRPSATSNVDQDGFTGGDLVGIRVDQSGTLVGTFTNGRSFGLAQVATAKFANDEGLTSVGGNIFEQSGNSGEPIVGTAATGGRGTIRSSSLEASNVDLSRSLTQLIIIQRGYQANGKTITTSDQILNTLINLKN